MKYFLIFIFSIYSASEIQAQKVTLEQCIGLANENFPLLKKQNLIKENTIYLNSIMANAFMPQVGLNGQATYQNETTHFPNAPATLKMPEISKDQYRLYAEVSQLIFDGGIGRAQKKVNAANELVLLKQTETGFQQIKEKVVQLYFGVLLQNAKLEQQFLMTDNLQQALEKAEAALANRLTYKSTVSELKAEIVNQQIQQDETKWNRNAFVEMLSIITFQPLDSNTVFEVPADVTGVETEIHRDELQLIDLQKEVINLQVQKLKTDWTPRLSAFVQGGAGRPGMNMLDDRFRPFAIGGLRLQVPFSNMYNYKNNRSIMNNNAAMMDVDKEMFLMNTRIELQKEIAEVEKLDRLIAQDKQAIQLRREVSLSAKAQLENGVITSHEYIQKLNAENLAAQLLHIHKIQRLQALYNIKVITGN